MRAGYKEKKMYNTAETQRSVYGVRDAYDLALSFIKSQGYEFRRRPADEVAGYAIACGGHPLQSVLGLTHEAHRVVLIASDVGEELEDFVMAHEAAHVALNSEVLGVREQCSRFHEDVANIVAVRLAGNPFGSDIVIRYNEAVRVADRVLVRLQGGSR